MHASRTVRRLRLRAPSEDGVHRAAVGFEDALRTATLPDGGGRVLLVRRLSLGPIRRRLPPAQVAVALERAFAGTDFAWRHGSAPDAGAAPAVWFRDALDAHVLLARRLVSGPPPVEWFWPLAVSRWDGIMRPLEGLRRVVLSLAMGQEAAAALPEWFAALARSGRVDEVVAALRPDDLPALARSAGLSWRDDRQRALLSSSSYGPAPLGGPYYSGKRAPHGAVPHFFTLLGTTSGADRGAEGAEDPDPEVAARRFVRDILAAAGLSREAASVLARVGLPSHATSATEGTAAAIRRDPAATAGSLGRPPGGGEPPGARRPPVQLPAPGDAARRSDVEGMARSSETTDVRGAWSREPAIHTTRDPQALPGEIPTSAGGLLFLLSVFGRIGYDDWLRRQHGRTHQEIARRVLQRVLAGLRVDAEDPVWTAVVADVSASDLPSHFVAPREWRSGLLLRRGEFRRGTWLGGSALYDPTGRLLLAAVPGRRFQRRPEHSRCATAEFSPLRSLDELVVEAWGVAIRRWLRRNARIGVADLVLRPAALAVTRTHVDVRCDLDRADLRVRRVGLDLDPGWLPWFGRVVSFHYGRGAR